MTKTLEELNEQISNKRYELDGLETYLWTLMSEKCRMCFRLKPGDIIRTKRTTTGGWFSKAKHYYQYSLVEDVTFDYDLDRNIPDTDIPADWVKVRTWPILSNGDIQRHPGVEYSLMPRDAETAEVVDHLDDYQEIKRLDLSKYDDTRP